MYIVFAFHNFTVLLCTCIFSINKNKQVLYSLADDAQYKLLGDKVQVILQLVKGSK